MGSSISPLLGGLPSFVNPKPPKQAAPIVTPAPVMQSSKSPDVSAIRTNLAGSGQAGGSPGVAQTFLTGAGGVDPSTLTLGRTLLLGN